MLYKIMLADDEPIMRKALLTLTNWQDIGCEVVYTAQNGREVLEHMEELAPDILITDIKMPGKDGMEIAKYIWENRLPVKVILLTAYADFSYAQSAVKYGVMDYVTKTGVFDELITAVENAKVSIEEERLSRERSTQEAAVENAFKSVFDSSLYGEEEIEAEFRKLPLHLENYMILLLQYRISEEREKKGVKEIYKSLINFFNMVFGARMVQAVPVERDMFAIVLNDTGEYFEDTVMHQSYQVMDMLDNFMKLYTYIGIGNVHTKVSELKEAYREGEYALSYEFANAKSKINRYRECVESSEAYPVGMEGLVEQVCAGIRKGNAKETKVLFERLVDSQRVNNCSAHLIQNTGILIQNKCRTMLAGYDKTIYEVTGMQAGISQSIYQCRHMEEFEKIMNKIIARTAGFIHIAANKKKSLIYDCQKCIEMHFEENIMVVDIAREVGASASYLSRIFKEITGRTIIFTLNQKKLEKAKEYLKNTDMKVYEIAEKLGFENSTYFSHFFKKHMGMSPKDYKGEEK